PDRQHHDDQDKHDSSVRPAGPGRPRRVLRHFRRSAPRLVAQNAESGAIGTADYRGDMNDEPQQAEYVVEYLDGPLEGQSERRALVNGEPEDAFTAFAAVEGVESM